MFQSTRPRGARPEIQPAATAARKFQSTRPRGARRLLADEVRAVQHVSIHAPAWGATFAADCRRRSRCCFNPRARVGRDANSERSSLPAVAFQSTRPRGARRADDVQAPRSTAVSIHAPAWGATLANVGGAVQLVAFQSTRPRGARPTAPRAWAPTRGFQSTRPRGARQNGREEFEPTDAFQSTRPRGARRSPRPPSSSRAACFNPRARVGRDGFADAVCRDANRFNPRARVGRDACRCARRPRRWRFQSTRPRGARLHASFSCSSARAFQSTRPRGARQSRCGCGPQDVSVSIHAPAWGATALPPLARKVAAVSIHAPAWGATRIPLRRTRGTRCFNPRARVGRDAAVCARLAELLEFQSTRPRGARHPTFRRLDAFNAFQSTRPRGARQPMESWHRIPGRVSIHAPAWGATRGGICARSPHRRVSIHAPAWGATCPACKGRGTVERFNPRARVGRDRRCLRAPGGTA